MITWLLVGEGILLVISIVLILAFTDLSDDVSNMADNNANLDASNYRLYQKFSRLTDKHNAFVDAVRDEFDNIYEETNDRIDEINNEFHNVYEVLNSNKEFADDVTDTMELMCDTDEIVIDRLRDFEEALAITNVTLDEIIEEMFKEQPEQAEEEKPAKKEKKNKKK